MAMRRGGMTGMAGAALCWLGFALLGLLLAPYVACLGLWVAAGLAGRAARGLGRLRLRLAQ